MSNKKDREIVEKMIENSIRLNLTTKEVSALHRMMEENERIEREIADWKSINRENREEIDNLKALKDKKGLSREEMWVALTKAHGCKTTTEDCNFRKCHHWSSCERIVEELLSAGEMIL